MIIKELLISLGYDLDKDTLKNLDKFEAGVLKAVKRLAKMIAVVTAVTAAVVTFVAVMERSVDTLGKSADRIGIAVEQLDALRFAANIAAGSANGLDSALERLIRTAAEAREGRGGGVEAFGFLQVDPNQVRDPIRLIEAVADGLQRFDRAKQLELAEKLGLGQFILLLDRGSKGVRELVEEANMLGVVTAEDARIAAEFNDVFFKTFNRLTRIIRVFAASQLAPVIQDIVKEINEWTQANSELIRTELTGVLKIVGKLLRVVFTLVRTGIFLIGGLISAVGGLTNALRVLLVVLGLVAIFTIATSIATITLAIKALIPVIATLWVALAPFAILVLKIAAVVALLVLIGLVIEDIVALFDPNKESFFDKLIEKVPALEAVFKPLATLLATIESTVGSIIDLISGDISLENFTERLKGQSKNLVDSVKEDPEALVGILGGPGTEFLVGLGKKAFNAVAGPSAAPAGTLTGTGTAGIGAFNQTVNMPITVNGGGDPDKIGRAVQDGMGATIRKALQDINSGITK